MRGWIDLLFMVSGTGAMCGRWCSVDDDGVGSNKVLATNENCDTNDDERPASSFPTFLIVDLNGLVE